MKINLKNFSENNRQFIKLISANAISQFGDSIDTVAFPWLTYRATNSAVLAAAVFGINGFVPITFQPVIGNVVENIHKRKVMTYSGSLRFAAILVFSLYIAWDLLVPQLLWVLP